jgi:hypothetical protein
VILDATRSRSAASENRWVRVKKKFVPGADIYMSSVMWAQGIGLGRSGDSYRHITVDCRMREGYEFKISNGDSLLHRPLHLSFRTRTPADAPLESGVGRLFHKPDGLDGGPFVNGWAFLPDDALETLWHQITSGLFTDSTIDLGVSPVEWGVEDPVWMIDQGPLVIETVSWRFTRPGRLESPPLPKAGLFGRLR